MTPAKRRPGTPASDGPTRTAPDVPRAKTKDGTHLLGPEGEPITEEASTVDAGGDSAPPTETGLVGSEDPATTKSRRRPGGLYPLPVWPD